jgi:uncharacterized protein (TIGR03437 family)
VRFLACASLLAIAAAAEAAPVLRLSTSAVVIETAVGTNPPPQTITASNAGDGTLSLSISVAAGAPWLTGATMSGNTIQFTFNTAALARGVYTATATVSDPNAIDAPQTVTVTVQVGSPPFATVDRYIGPGQTAYYPLASGSCFQFRTGCTLPVPTATTSTADGGMWLQVSSGYSYTTIGFSYSVDFYLAPPATMASGVYTGSVTGQGTSDDHPIPVTMRVTTLPIAVPSTTQINLRLAQGGPAMTAPFLPPISLTNSGMGALSVRRVSAQGTGVTAVQQNSVAVVTVDPGSLAPGIYNDGVVTIDCNGANCPVQVPVSLQVVPQAPAVVFYQGVVDNATFSAGYGVAPGDIAVVAGEQLSMQVPQSAASFPLPTSLGGASVLVNDVQAPLYYTSYGQVAFQVPSSTVAGTALVQVVRDGQPGNRVTVNVKPAAPQIVVITDASYNIRDATHPTHAGETLILWCIGLGGTNPAVPDGTPAPSIPLAGATHAVQVDGPWYPPLTPSFAGLAPGEAGVYQVIFTLPQNTPTGMASISLFETATSAPVTLLVQ